MKTKFFSKTTMKPVQFYILLTILLITHSHAAVSSRTLEDHECIVRIQNGTIIGKLSDTASPSKMVCAYMGIPFASPPVGPLRFKPPQPAQAWDSVLNATELPNWCPQTGDPSPGYNMSEDCLYLNVYQPKNASGQNLPVMIWIHGGAFMFGSSELYTPTKLLASGDIILVVAHYRLGLLGFFSTGDDISPGNYGLLDQQFSIRWVHENIRAFGGNPGQVTIFGESAGGASVIFQLLSPLNKGLIHGVIAQSGSALTSWAMDTHTEPTAEPAKLMAERLDCPTNSSLAMVDCISKLSWETIIQKQSEYVEESLQNMTYHYAGITPVVEPDLPGAFITKHPLEILRNGSIDNVPVMLGATKHDGSFDVALLYLENIGKFGKDNDPVYMREQLVPDIVKFTNIWGDDANRGVASSLEMTYLSGVNRSSWNDSMPGLVDLLSVITYKSSMEATANLLSRRGMKVYLYSFEHHSNNSLFSVYFDQSLVDIPVELEHGVMHSDDLMYLFDYPAQFSEEDQQFSEKFCDLWLNFGKSGNPTPSPSDRYDEWPVYTAANDAYMKLNVTPTAMSGYRSSWRPNGFEWN